MAKKIVNLGGENGERPYLHNFKFKTPGGEGYLNAIKKLKHINPDF